MANAAHKRRKPQSRARAADIATPKIKAFDAGRFQRRLKALPTSAQAINAQIRTYGRTVLARSRYLCANNPYAAAAKETYVSALIGCGIKPSPLTKDADLKKAITEAWLYWTDESDADGLTDLYGQMATIGGEMFEAGECFARFRQRRPEDGLSVPLQVQLLPSEMLPLNLNRDLGNGNSIQMGIEFNALGQRVAYHFLRQHPGDNFTLISLSPSQITRVPASEVLHLYKPMRAGQIRGLPRTISSIAKLALFDQYDDAELERKKTAALNAGFIERTDAQSTFLNKVAEEKAKTATGADAGVATVDWQPGTITQLLPGEKMSFSEPADVGPNYEMFQYRTLLGCAAGMGVPYAGMTGDLRQTSYGSMRGGEVRFRRQIEREQHTIMVFQFCRAIWQRWIGAAVLAGALPIKPAEFLKRIKELMAVKWMPPKWEWIDPLNDLQAEKLAVRAGFKSRGDVIEELGYDPQETDARITEDRDRAASTHLVFDSDAHQVSDAGVTQQRPTGEQLAPDGATEGDHPTSDLGNTKPTSRAPAALN